MPWGVGDKDRMEGKLSESEIIEELRSCSIGWLRLVDAEFACRMLRPLEKRVSCFKVIRQRRDVTRRSAHGLSEEV